MRPAGAHWVVPHRLGPGRRGSADGAGPGHLVRPAPARPPRSAPAADGQQGGGGASSGACVHGGHLHVVIGHPGPDALLPGHHVQLLPRPRPAPASPVRPRWPPAGRLVQPRPAAGAWLLGAEPPDRGPALVPAAAGVAVLGAVPRVARVAAPQLGPAVAALLLPVAGVVVVELVLEVGWRVSGLVPGVHGDTALVTGHRTTDPCPVMRPGQLERASDSVATFLHVYVLDQNTFS